MEETKKINYNFYGIDAENIIFNPNILIDTVNNNGGILRLYGQNVITFTETLTNILATDVNDYKDGYPTDIYKNVAIKLNGIYFENFIEKYASANVLRKSNSVFSKDKVYEAGTDFIIKSYTIKNSDTTVSEKPLEAKNCNTMKYMPKIRKHNTLYLIVNTRAENKMKLLCKLTKKDYDHLEDFEVYDKFKVIDNWFWINNLYKYYFKERLNYSWEVNCGTDNIGDYIEFISPLKSNKKSIY